MGSAVSVKGLADLNRAFAKAGKDTRKAMRIIERGIGEPVAATAQGLAVTNISGLARAKNPKWAGMRVGVTRKLIYVAPKQRGRQTKKNRRLARPNMGDLLMQKAMEPALEAHRPRLETAVERALDRMADHFNQGGIPNA